MAARPMLTLLGMLAVSLVLTGCKNGKSWCCGGDRCCNQEETAAPHGKPAGHARNGKSKGATQTAAAAEASQPPSRTWNPPARPQTVAAPVRPQQEPEVTGGTMRITTPATARSTPPLPTPPITKAFTTTSPVEAAPAVPVPSIPEPTTAANPVTPVVNQETVPLTTAAEPGSPQPEWPTQAPAAPVMEASVPPSLPTPTMEASPVPVHETARPNFPAENDSAPVQMQAAPPTGGQIHEVPASNPVSLELPAVQPPPPPTMPGSGPDLSGSR